MSNIEKDTDTDIFICDICNFKSKKIVVIKNI